MRRVRLALPALLAATVTVFGLCLGGCRTAGLKGVDRAHWDRYQCAQGFLWLWDLWTNL